MKNNLCSHNLKQQPGFGLTGALLTGAYTLCVCAVTGQGLLAFLICCTLCFIFSIKNKQSIFAPDAFLSLPLFFTLGNGSPFAAGLAITGGSLVFLAISKLFKNRTLPRFVVSGAALGLTVGVTILLTNAYFGIGAGSSTPFEMLKEFRSLGFHPNFRGLFYGTITLFAMITFPFKFKKLNKYIPGAFVSILIPFVFNLFLNPHKELTTINESVSLVFAGAPASELQYFFNISSRDIPLIIKGAVGFGVIFYIFNTEKNGVFIMNCANGALSGLPVRKHFIRGYGAVAAVISVIIIAITVFLFPSTLSRLPLHSAGSMLIVAAWQSVPFALLKGIFKERRFPEILLMLVCAVPFVLTDVFTSVLICLAVCALSAKLPSARKEFTE
ncbi:MAG: hypothetical protein IJ025_02850 [Clostridia bacterium]|nr:hypothetical protein [Clostridia bacterium]